MEKGPRYNPEQNPETDNRPPMQKVEDFATEIRSAKYMKDLLEGANEQLIKENEELQRGNQQARRKHEVLEAQLVEAEQRAEHDPLTGMLNRAGLNTVAEQLKQENIDSVMIMLDIDNFKAVNDKFGHIMGDDVLKKAAGFLQDKFRPTDFLVRLGGEELIILLPNASIDDTKSMLERISGGLKLEMPFDFKSKSRPDNLVTFSGGIVEFKAGDDLQSALDKADQALYVAKRNGRNQLLVADGADVDAGVKQ